MRKLQAFEVNGTWIASLPWAVDEVASCELWAVSCVHGDGADMGGGGEGDGSAQQKKKSASHGSHHHSMRGIRPPHHRPCPERAHQLHLLCSPRRSFHKLSRVPRRVQLRQSPVRTSQMAQPAARPAYEQWTHEQLVARIRHLESQAQALGLGQDQTIDQTPAQPQKQKQPPKPFDASRYTTRLVALKFAYLGQKYNGLEHHANNQTPLPTIEEELWKALVKTRLISPTPRTPEEAATYASLSRKTFDRWDRDGAEVNWDGCEYSKCGRTDRGVSAFGQVVGVRLRSNRKKLSEDDDAQGQDTAGRDPAFDDTKDELPYIQLLNRVLPPDVRVYAWCPNPPSDFSARFSCKERRYKYFFTNPCFAPVPGASARYHAPSSSDMREGWLDIEKMREACKLLEGLHDFRNFCKIDASKQLSNFTRRIFHASIEPVSPLSTPSFISHPALQNSSTQAQPTMYAFVLHGSAFLWHQVRSIVAILFLIGQRLESPSLVTELMDISKNPTRPKYEMASDAPLVLWDCIFPDPSEVQSSEEREHGYTDALGWIYVGDEGGMELKTPGKAKTSGTDAAGKGKWGRGGVMDDVWELWRGHKMDETLSALLLDAIAEQGTSTLDKEEIAEGSGVPKGGPRVFDGGNVGRAKGNYTPVLQRERQEPVEVVNERYAKKKGLDMNRKKPAEEEADE